MMYNLFAWGENHKVEIRKSSYVTNGNLALSLWEINEGPYATLTVNLDETLPMNLTWFGCSTTSFVSILTMDESL